MVDLVPRLACHGLHELIERYATIFFHIVLSNDLVNCLFARSEAILAQQQFQIIRKQHSSFGRIIVIEYFLKLLDIFLGDVSCDVVPGIELSKIFASESDIKVRALLHNVIIAVHAICKMARTVGFLCT